MGSYTVIADSSEAVLKALRTACVPQVIPDENGVGLCSPKDAGEYSLGVFLYDIQTSDEIRQLGMLNLDENRQQGPPAWLSLYYMITAYSQSDRKYQMIQEQRILGRAIQYFHDYPYLELEGEQISMQLLKVSTEDKIKLWNFPEKPYMTSAFYKASPVRLDSAAVRKVTRVQTRSVRTELLAPENTKRAVLERSDI